MHPQVAFSVKQKTPGTLDDAVTTMLDMESYTESSSNRIGAVPTPGKRDRYLRCNRHSVEADSHGGAIERASGDATARSIADEASAS